MSSYLLGLPSLRPAGAAPAFPLETAAWIEHQSCVLAVATYIKFATLCFTHVRYQALLSACRQQSALTNLMPISEGKTKHGRASAALSDWRYPMELPAAPLRGACGFLYDASVKLQRHEGVP